MRLGFNLPHMGPEAGPEAINHVATAAEAAGYETLWTTDRLLYPATPRTPYAGTPDGILPDVYRRVIDPLDALTWAAAATKKIGLGTSILNMPFYAHRGVRGRMAAGRDPACRHEADVGGNPRDGQVRRPRHQQDGVRRARQHRRAAGRRPLHLHRLKG